MKERINNERSIWPVLILSVITLGIYPIWYYHKIVQDVNLICEEDGKRSPGVLVWLVLTLLTCGIYNMLWWCNMHDRLRATAKTKGVTIEQTTSGLMLLFIGAYFVMGILTWVALHKFLSTLNDMATAYNREIGHYN